MRNYWRVLGSHTSPGLLLPFSTDTFPDSISTLPWPPLASAPEQSLQDEPWKRRQKWITYDVEIVSDRLRRTADRNVGRPGAGSRRLVTISSGPMLSARHTLDGGRIQRPAQSAGQGCRQCLQPSEYGARIRVQRDRDSRGFARIADAVGWWRSAARGLHTECGGRGGDIQHGDRGQSGWQDRRVRLRPHPTADGHLHLRAV